MLGSRLQREGLGGWWSPQVTAVQGAGIGATRLGSQEQLAVVPKLPLVLGLRRCLLMSRSVLKDLQRGDSTASWKAAISEIASMGRKF